jgi:ring-1,2-phenylacetyl-CoA epoxidase subunit PaaE
MTGLLTPAATTTRRSTFHPLTVVGVERLTDEATAITFAIPGELTESYRFLPGQHLTLRRQVDGAEVRNSYSICQSAQAGGGATLRVAAAKVPGGRMSPWLVDELAVGDVVDVMTPLGTFTCPARPDEARHHLAIAAGSGITPVLSLVTTASSRSRVRG